MKGDPCSVCAGTDLNLIDGFYYCIECGTQNTNVRETVVEQTILADGTFAKLRRKKIVTLDNTIHMSNEWYKWHAFNFILCGLADELIAAGAKPSFKTKLLWIWSKYIKKYQNKDDFGLDKTNKANNTDNNIAHTFLFEENSTSNAIPDEDRDKDEKSQVEGEREPVKKKSKMNVIVEGSSRDIRFLSIGLIVSMLYLALNLDKSDIQLSHLYRFIKEKRVNIKNLQRFVPKEIPVKNISEWINFIHSKLYKKHFIRRSSLSLLIILDLGTPIVPDLRKILDNFLIELCLPNDMKPLIYSLMHFYNCNFLDINNRTKNSLRRLPDYEAVVMSYILVAMKMCFGLDNVYDDKICDVVDKINEDRDLTKSIKLGKYSEPSNRLFSFREWCNFMQYRKIMLCKYCLYMADQHFLDIDDYVYLEHMDETPQREKDLQDETAIDILKKIPLESEGRVIPKELFIPSLTPMSDYTDIIIQHTQDQETRFLLSEDYTQYSLKYACEYLELKDINGQNIITGINEERKTINKMNFLGTLVMKHSNIEMVYIKNCDNPNWMTTNPPTLEHVTCEDTQNLSSNDKESDHGYDSENPTNDKEISKETEVDINTVDNIEVVNENDKQNTIPEEVIDKNIFDDDFEEFDIKDDNEADDQLDNIEDRPPQNSNFPDDDLDSLSNHSDTDSITAVFNPNTFDRERTIKELILHACKKYKITIPKEYRTVDQRKRKFDAIRDEAGPSTSKRPKTKRGESKQKINELLSDYYTCMQSDLLTKVQQEVSLAIRNAQISGVLDPNSDIEGDGGICNPENISVLDEQENKSICTENTEIINSTQDVNCNLDETKNTDLNEKRYCNDIDEDDESKLFDDDVIEPEDTISKGDPKFDAAKYDTKQLYIKMNIDEEIAVDDEFDPEDDLQLTALLDRPIEDAKSQNTGQIKSKYESDSDDELLLSDIQKEKQLLEEMWAKEDSFEPLINKDKIPNFKYWVRHYDNLFMQRNLDWYEKFDRELNENTPTSFNFVIKECASVMDCTSFYLYRELQHVEEYMISRSKNQ